MIDIEKYLVERIAERSSYLCSLFCEPFLDHNLIRMY